MIWRDRQFFTVERETPKFAARASIVTSVLAGGEGDVVLDINGFRQQSAAARGRARGVWVPSDYGRLLRPCRTAP